MQNKKKARLLCNQGRARMELKRWGKYIMIDDKNNNNALTGTVIRMLSGVGQFHTANPETKNPKPYNTVTWADIRRMVKNPVDVPKAEAPWFIPSDFTGTLARVHAEQLKNGRFYALWADLDEVGSLTILGVSTTLRSILPGVQAFIYNTKSATPDNGKCRIIVPLATPCNGQDFILYQKIFNDKLDKAGITPDRATERTAQLCYLPNRGEHYGHVITEGGPFK